jgi:hypothetical protein
MTTQMPEGHHRIWILRRPSSGTIGIHNHGFTDNDWGGGKDRQIYHRGAH